MRRLLGLPAFVIEIRSINPETRFEQVVRSIPLADRVLAHGEFARQLRLDPGAYAPDSHRRLVLRDLNVGRSLGGRHRR